MAKKSKAQKEAKPAFDDAALTKLTAKIDTALSKPTNNDQKPKEKKKSKDQKPKDQKAKEDRPAKRKRSDNDTKGAAPKKRLAQEPVNGTDKPQKPQKSAKDRKLELLEEIKALGGDENDLDLVAGIDSDAEEGQGPKPGKTSEGIDDKALKNELAKFAAGLGFEQVLDEAVASEDEAQEPEAEEHEQEAEESEAEESEDEPEQEAEAPPAEEPQKRSAAGKLVSMRHLVRARLSGV